MKSDLYQYLLHWQHKSQLPLISPSCTSCQRYRYYYCLKLNSDVLPARWVFHIFSSHPDAAKSLTGVFFFFLYVPTAINSKAISSQVFSWTKIAASAFASSARQLLRLWKYCSQFSLVTYQIFLGQEHKAAIKYFRCIFSLYVLHVNFLPSHTKH